MAASLNTGPSLLADAHRHACGFCLSASALTSDTPEQRLYTCRNRECGAVETITKGSGLGWWYHGWKRPDGSRLRAPTVQEMQRGDHGWQPETVRSAP